MVKSSHIMSSLTPYDPNQPPDKDFKMTAQEQKRFKECLKDEKFLSLFQDYIKEVNDPKNVKEREDYLRQMEGATKNIGGGKQQLVLPRGKFCIRCSNRKDEKIFINVCEHECIEDFQIIPDAVRQAVYRIPLSLGREQVHEDENGKFYVYDIVYSPNSCKVSESDHVMKKFMIDTAIEEVKMKHKQDIRHIGDLESNNYEFFLQNDLQGKPLAQSIRVDENNPLPKRKVDTDEKKDSTIPDTNTKRGALVKSKITGGPKGDLYDKMAATLLGDSQKTDELNELKMPEKKKGRIEELSTPVANIPKYKIIHQGHFKLENHTIAQFDQNRIVPENLVVKISLPGLKSAKTIDVDITELNLFLKEPTCNYKLDLSLPYPVDSDNGSAKFNKKLQELAITIPVNIPKESIVQEPLNDVEIVNENDVREQEHKQRVAEYQRKLEEQRLKEQRETKEREDQRQKLLQQEEEKQEEMKVDHVSSHEPVLSEEELAEQSKQKLIEERKRVESLRATVKQTEAPVNKQPPSQSLEATSVHTKTLESVATEQTEEPVNAKTHRPKDYETQFFEIEFKNKYIYEID